MNKIMVVDDYSPALNRIVKHISRLGEYEITATANDGYQLIKFCYHEKILPDIVLLDVLMPKLDGVSTMEYLHTYFPSIKVIAISSFEMEHVVTDMIASGAWGYIFKDKEMDMLADALSSVASGKPYVDPRLMFDASQRDSLIQKRQHERALLFDKLGLSRREKELIGLIVSNMDYSEIGTILNIAPKTIENTVQALTKKLGISNGRAGLLIHSLRFGLTKMMSTSG